MDNRELLELIKQVRNVFDTIGIESGMASRNTMDVWGEILQGEKSFVSFAHNIKNKTNVLRSLLYSIDKFANDILSAKAEENIHE